MNKNKKNPLAFLQTSDPKRLMAGHVREECLGRSLYISGLFAKERISVYLNDSLE